jgi:hypothetical protein
MSSSNGNSNVLRTVVSDLALSVFDTLAPGTYSFVFTGLAGTNFRTNGDSTKYGATLSITQVNIDGGGVFTQYTVTYVGGTWINVCQTGTTQIGWSSWTQIVDTHLVSPF